MRRSTAVPRIALLALVLFAIAAPVSAQWPPKQFKNLKVLPSDIPPEQLVDIMRGYTRALGVRCTACHVGEEGKPLTTFDFASDEKENKRKAREMIKMTNDLNQKYLAALEKRNDPPVYVGCVTCHRGVREPRQLDDVLETTYDRSGLDSTIIRYSALRERYYGRAAYDFGEVPLSDVAAHVEHGPRPADAVRLHALNVEMNPKSGFAKRLHAAASIEYAYIDGGSAAGHGTFEDFQSRYGTEMVNEGLLTEIAESLLERGHKFQAIEALSWIAIRNPNNPDALSNLGDAYAQTGDTKKASISYKQALAQDPTNERAKAALAALEQQKKKK